MVETSLRPLCLSSLIVIIFYDALHKLLHHRKSNLALSKIERYVTDWPFSQIDFCYGATSGTYNLEKDFKINILAVFDRNKITLQLSKYVLKII